MNKALLAWCHANYQAFPHNVRLAHHIINWHGEMALAACVTEDDYRVVAACYEIAIRIINEN